VSAAPPASPPPLGGSEPLRLPRLVGLSLVAYVLMLGYALARPSTESLFLETWGRDALPWAWVGVAVGAALAVSGWQRLARRLELAAVVAAVCAISGALLALLLLAHQAGLHAASFLLYVWKDVYIVVLVETFYAFGNVVFPLRTARWAYGFFGAMGSLGGITGNLLVGRLADRIGTAEVPWLVLVDLVLVGTLALVLSRWAGAGAPVAVAPRPGLLEGWRVVRGSRTLLLVLAMIAVVQVAINVVDFAFAGALERAFPDTDGRTGVIGQVYAAIDACTLVLNLLTGPVLRVVGVPGTLLGLPLVLGSACVGALALPGFAPIALTKVASKAFDYSLFRAAKEAVYLPLSYREKTEGKAVVDMLTYRVAKGGASALTLGMVALAAQAWALPLVLGLVGAWLGLARAIGRRYRLPSDAGPSAARPSEGA